MSLINSSLNIVNWLVLATDTTADGKRVKERYRMNTNDWKVYYRPDCNIETAYAFLKMWEYSKDDTYLQLSRDIYDSIIKLRYSNGTFPFSHTGDLTIYTNDNSEIPIFLTRMAEVDLERKDMYIESALKSTDYIITKQNSDGSWGETLGNATGYPFFSAQAISALSTLYPHTSNKSGYKTAIEKGLDWIGTNILSDGRVKICNEIKTGVEWWRPPTSDQSIVIRGFAHAEFYVKDSTKSYEWKNNRIKLLNWLNKCIDSNSGALTNGLGKGVNGADVNYITDHVYTTAFGIEAYLYSYYVDKNKDYILKANGIVNFANSNLYYSSVPEANGILRGAYNLREKNWDTSSVSQNSGEEGGGNMIYSGWTNAPIVGLFFIFNGLIGKYQLKIKTNTNTMEIPILDNSNGAFKIIVNNSVYSIPIVNIYDENASPLRICVAPNTIKALKKI